MAEEYEIEWGCSIVIKSNSESEGQFVADTMEQQIEMLIDRLKNQYSGVEVTMEW